MSAFVVRSSRRQGGVLLASLALALPVALQAEPAPVFEAVNESGVIRQVEDMDQRLSRLERQLDSQGLVEMMSGMDRLQQEIQQLVGQIEEQNHSLENLQKRQRDLYLDIDKRIRALEEARAAAPAIAPAAVASPAPAMPANSGFAAAPPATGSVSPGRPAVAPAPAAPSQAEPAAATPATANPVQPDGQLERKNYEFAFNLLKQGQYDQAVAAFQAFMKTYPTGRFSDNAQYWLGEANYVQRRFNDALAEFDKVVKNYPNSPKRADAMLKMGYTYQELDDFEKARVLLNDVIRDYPNSTAANLAKKRLQDFKLLQ